MCKSVNSGHSKRMLLHRYQPNHFAIIHISSRLKANSTPTRTLLHRFQLRGLSASLFAPFTRSPRAFNILAKRSLRLFRFAFLEPRSDSTFAHLSSASMNLYLLTAAPGLVSLLSPCCLTARSAAMGRARAAAKDSR